MSTLSRTGVAGTGIRHQLTQLRSLAFAGSAARSLCCLHPGVSWWPTPHTPLAIRNGGSDETGTEALALSAAHPLLLRVTLLAGMVGCLLLVPAVMGAPPRSDQPAGVRRRIAHDQAICYFRVLTSSFGTLAMAARGGPMADFAAVIDASESDSWTAGYFHSSSSATSWVRRCSRWVCYTARLPLPGRHWAS
jgi:hypothetical protein